MKAKQWLTIFFSISFIAAAAVQLLLVYLDIPLRYSDSISYDAKLNFIKKNHLLRDADTLIIGSSLSLNNINGMVLEDNSSKIDKVANLASWGLEISQTLDLVKLLDLKNIKYIILSTQYSDFSKKFSYTINFNDVKDCLHNRDTIGPYTKRFTTALLNYDMYLNFDKLYHDPNSYKSLIFDRTGGVNLNFPKKYISKKRWNSTEEFEHSLLDSSFRALTELARLCRDNKIELIVAISPIRIEISNKSKVKQNIGLLLQKIKTISEDEHFLYIDAHNIFPDKYFLDAEHLTLEGTVLYSYFILKRAEL